MGFDAGPAKDAAAERARQLVDQIRSSSSTRLGHQ